MANSDTPVIPFTSREYSVVLDALKTFVQSTNGAVLSDFTQSNAGLMLLSVAAAVVDTISAGQDFAAAEAFLATCRTYEAALRFAKSVGYIPRAASAATVTVVANPLPASIFSGGATVAGGQVVSIGSVPYLLLDDVTIPPSQTALGFNLIQAQVFSEAFAATANQFQIVTTTNAIVAQSSWHIFVGDPSNPANEWTQVDELLLLDSASNSYQITFDSAGHIIIMFGNGISGAIPTQTITVNYQTTQGSVGNLPVFAVTGALTAAIGGGVINLAVSNTQGAAIGGADRESLAELKRNIPAYIRTNQRVVTLGDYEDFLSMQAGVALAYADVSVASYQYNIVKSYVWGSQNVTFVAESSNGATHSSTPYTQYAQISPEAVVNIHAALSDKTMVSVYNRVLQPTTAFADIYVGNIKYDPRYDPILLHQQITEAVVNVFETSGGFTVAMGDITDAIRGVLGVRRFNIERVVWDYLRGGRATGSIIFSGNPSDGDLISINDGVRGVVYEFDSNNAVGTGRIKVTIGNSAETTATNLINAINQTIAIRAYRNPTLGGPTVSLLHSRIGDTFNIPLVPASTVLSVTGMTGGTFDRVLVREDRRLDQNPIPDKYPVGTYTAGATDGSGSGWAIGGVPPYLPLRDLEILAVKSARNIYDQQFLFNDEIRYDSGVELTPDVQAINLRRLVMNLVADTRVNQGF